MKGRDIILALREAAEHLVLSALCAGMAVFAALFFCICRIFGIDFGEEDF